MAEHGEIDHAAAPGSGWLDAVLAGSTVILCLPAILGASSVLIMMLSGFGPPPAALMAAAGLLAYSSLPATLLALVSGAFWLVRRRWSAPYSKAVAALLVLSLLLTAGFCTVMFVVGSALQR